MDYGTKQQQQQQNKYIFKLFFGENVSADFQKLLPQ